MGLCQLLLFPWKVSEGLFLLKDHFKNKLQTRFSVVRGFGLKTWPCVEVEQKPPLHPEKGLDGIMIVFFRGTLLRLKGPWVGSLREFCVYAESACFTFKVFLAPEFLGGKFTCIYTLLFTQKSASLFLKEPFKMLLGLFLRLSRSRCNSHFNVSRHSCVV